MELVLFIGIQATGKSEFYKRTFYKTHVRLNLDMLKTRHRESIFLDACIRAKQPFVVDNTNPTRQDRQKYIQLAKAAGFTVAGFYFQSKIKDCLARNEMRTGKEKLPARALLATHRKLEPPQANEGFDHLHYVYIGENNQFVVEEYTDEV